MMEQALDWAVESAPSAATAKSYEGHAARVLTRFGFDAVLSDLTRTDVAAFIDRRCSEVSRHTVHKELVMLRKALKEALTRELEVPDPARVIPTFHRKYQARERWLTQDEYEKLQAVLPLERQAFVAFAVYTGANLSELRGLQPGDVGDTSIHIRGTKRDRRYRYVPISPALRPWLSALPLDPWRNVHQALPRFCEKAGIDRVTPNDLRRTFGSWLVQSGASIEEVAALLGNSVQVAAKTYAHLAADNLERAVARLPVGHVLRSV